MSEHKKVLLGMSGGVDSSVAAVLLKKAGYEVIGVTLSLCPQGSCCNFESYMDAKKICDILGIEHFILEATGEFKKYVIDDFVEEYKNCATPNPCIQCNKYLKFGVMAEKAKSLGIDYIATGHYAISAYSQKYDRYVLKKSKNIAKDQSYVLYTIPKEMIKKMLFPLGEFKSKDQIREIAKKHDLPVASKPDSEDICFVPDGDYKTFLENNSDIQKKPGNIVDKNGNILGKHEGLYRYTIGQRKGLGISNAVPLFVTGYDKEKNELIVGEEKELYSREFFVKDVNLLAIDSIEKPMRVRIKTRYTAKDAVAVIMQMENGIIKVLLDDPQRAITKGQSAVFYDEDGVVIGGGIII